MKVLVTGGAGFIGSNYVKLRLNKEKENISRLIVLDKLTYAGTLENLEPVKNHEKFEFVKGDICDRNLVNDLVQEVDQIVNFAAESHVDRSIDKSEDFIRTNIVGTHTLLNALRFNPQATLLHVSTDEVYGSIEKGSWDEQAPISPNSPYAASKASSDLLALAYHRTYGLDVRISRCCNNYGPNQYPEKVIPLFITNLLRNKNLPVYGNGSNFREWIHVDDHCEALDLILEKGAAGQIYNIGSGFELNNLDLARKLLDFFNETDSKIEYVVDRLGHDFRYSLDAQKIVEEFGFKCNQNFDEGLKSTISWYKENADWWLSRATS